MIKSITVTNYRGDSLKLDLARPELSGFAVTSIKGLGPGKASISTSEVAAFDGSMFNSARLPDRNIVISLQYLWKDSIEETRQRSYKYFPLKKKLKLLIETDKRIAEIEGYVEENDPTIFSKNEGADISIICPDPHFYSAGPNGIQTTVFSGIMPMFEFPFSNESTTEPLLEFGSIELRGEHVVVYEGDADTGVTITAHALDYVEDLVIYNTGTREIMSIDSDKLEETTGSGIIAGDDIIICTEKRRKSVTLLRNGVSTNILNCLSRESDWFTLTKGDNVFGFSVKGDYENRIQFKVENKVVYEGV